MRFNKFVGSMAAATISVGALTGFTGTAHAQTVVTFGGDTPSIQDITFNGTTLQSVAGGALVTITADANSAETIDAFFTFGPTNIVSTTTSGGVINADFGPGSFSFGTAAGGNNLLAGTFSSINIIGGPGTASVLSFANEVTYLSGTLANTFASTFGSTIPFTGSFSIALNTLSAGALSTTGGNLNAFQANSIGGTFSATPNPIPEPSEWLAMGMAATSVGGLMFRAKLKLRAKRQVQTAA